MVALWTQTLAARAKRRFAAESPEAELREGTVAERANTPHVVLTVHQHIATLLGRQVKAYLNS